MAYGDTTTVATLTESRYGATLAAAAIVVSDILVDIINSDASATNKTAASNFIAAEILRKGRGTKLLDGLNSDGGDAGSPSRSISKYSDVIPAIVKDLLLTRPTIYHYTDYPSSSGSW